VSLVTPKHMLTCLKLSQGDFAGSCQDSVYTNANVCMSQNVQPQHTYTLWRQSFVLHRTIKLQTKGMLR